MLHRKLRGVSIEKGSAPDCVRLWTARILLAHGKEALFRKHGFHNEEILRAIGLDHYLEAEYEEIDHRDFFRELKQLCNKLVKQQKRGKGKYLKMNLCMLADLLGLTGIDCRLLEFTVYLHTDPVLHNAADMMGDLNNLQVVHELSRLLDLREAEIREALSRKGALARTHLLQIDPKRLGHLTTKLDLVSDAFANTMVSGKADVFDLVKGMVMRSPTAKLNLTDYQHIKQPLDLLLPYLEKVLAGKKQGVNFLIHGEPGTGKTELVRLLAKTNRCGLYEITFEDDDGDPVPGQYRLRASVIAQHFFANTRSLLLFDEVEDIFNDGGLHSRGTAQAHKAWVNRQLEDNRIPTFWLSNSIDSLDPAFVRRFDMVIEVGTPGKEHRERLVRAMGKGLVNEDAIARIAESAHVSPAVIERATKLVQAIRDEIPEDKCSESVEFLVSSTLRAQQHRGLKTAKRQGMEREVNRLFDVESLNVDTKLTALADGIKNATSARICFYGPPGTGKTELGRWLAQQMNKPLLVKRASDLMDMFVGGTEQKIARAFRAAEETKSILMMDEVDSLLSDRRSAQHRWEVSFVNEMLTQMESFQGVFIATTNMVDNLDQASLRRFDLKVKFGYLRPEKACQLLDSYAQVMGIPGDAAQHMATLRQLDVVAPGDFAALWRQHRFKPFTDLETFVQALANECRMKEGGAKRKMGFV